MVEFDNIRERLFMLSFRPIEKSDIDTIKYFTLHSGVMSCDFTLCGIYLWGIYYGYEMCVFEDTLFIKGRDEFGKEAFALPIGALPTEDAVAIVRDYCAQRSIKPRFSFVPAEKTDAFEGGRMQKLDGWSDYIYESESLANLSGKKLHKKKNRFNKFVKTYPDYRFESITSENISLVRDFYSRFLAENPSDSERLAAEEKIIARLMDEYAELGLNGGMITVDSEVIAFALGERVGDTLYVHFEKANRAFDGAYEAMNCLFVRNFADGAHYVDREEDMGDLGLRQAKTAYCPVRFVDKYEIRYSVE